MYCMHTYASSKTNKTKGLLTPWRQSRLVHSPADSLNFPRAQQHRHRYTGQDAAAAAAH